MLVIFAHGIVVTLDPNRRIIEDSAVVTEGDRIIAVDKTEEILDRYHSEPAEIIDCQRKLILPGLIDAHAHAGHSMFTMIGESMRSTVSLRRDLLISMHWAISIIRWFFMSTRMSEAVSSPGRSAISRASGRKRWG